MDESEFAKIDPAHNALPEAVGHRRAWTTPRVIASELRAARAHVGHGHDGSSPSYGPYGS